MEEYSQEFELNNKQYLLTFHKIGSGDPIIFEVLKIEPDDFHLPVDYAITYYKASGANCPVDGNKCTAELGNVIRDTIVKSCNSNGISLLE